MSVAGVILCGGLGRRMGGAIKPLLLKNGRTLLDRIETTIRPYIAELVVAATPPVLEAISSHTQARIVIDEGHGPGLALARVAASIEQEWILLVGGDHPFPDAAIVERLIAEAIDVDAVAYLADDRLQPLWAMYRSVAVRGLRPQAALTDMLRALSPKTISGNSRAFVSVNTLESAIECGVDVSTIYRPAGPGADP